MKHKDELDELLRRGANGPDGDLVDLLMQMRTAGLASAPVPSRLLATVLLAAPVDMLTPQDLARSPRQSGLGSRRTRLVGRLAALAPATKLLLAGSVAVAAVTGSVLAVDELNQDRRLRLDILTPATTSSSPDTPGPDTASAVISSLATASPVTSDSESSSGTAPTPRSTDDSAPSTRSGSPSPRSTSHSPRPAPSTSSETSTETSTETETETTHPESDPSTSGSSGRGGSGE